MSILQIQTARAFLPLLVPSRYKGVHGGRGSGKSQFFSGLIVDYAMERKGLRAVCIREVQKSLKESAKRLIEDQLGKYNLGEAEGFKVFREVIETPGDGLIMFQGMQDHTAESIKSLEGIDIAWVEEAQSLSTRSMGLLRPTIRKDDSELWFSWNPRLEHDPVDVMLRGPNPPTGAIVIKANWDANPWFPKVLEQERLDCLKTNPDQYAHIWEGDYVTVLEGAYYAKQIAEARRDGRVDINVARDPLMTTRAVFDIGGTGQKADAVAIWICQYIGKEIRYLNYHEAVGQELSYHIEWLRSNGYEKALCVLPHDGKANDKVFNVSYESALKQAGFQTRVIPNQGTGAAMKRIERARELFPRMWFDKKCAAGVKALSWYHEKIDEERRIGLGPDHDWSSHGADAHGLSAVDYKDPTNEFKEPAFKPRAVA